jgi:hypothetical protein
MGDHVGFQEPRRRRRARAHAARHARRIIPDAGVTPGAVPGAVRPSATRSRLLASGIAGVGAGIGVWLLWGRLGFPDDPFVPGLAGPGPDRLAWPRLLAAWAPAGHLLFNAVHAWLAGEDRAGALRRHRVADQLAAVLLGLALPAALVGLHGHPAWRLGLGAWFVAFVGARTAILLRAVAVWLVAGAPPPARAGAAVLASALVPYLLLGAHVTAAISATSDEPYYLLVAHSLLQDGDLDLANNLSARDFAPFYWDRLSAATPGVHATPDGRIYARSFQGLQVALLLPGYWLAGRAGAVATVNLAGALALALAFRLALAAGASVRSAFLAWLAARSRPPCSATPSPPGRR